MRRFFQWFVNAYRWAKDLPGKAWSSTRQWPFVHPIRAGALALCFVTLVIVFVPVWQVRWAHIDDTNKKFEYQNEARRTLASIVLGLGGGIALILTWRRVKAYDKQVEVAEQGHVTERYTRAIEQLGKMDGDKPNIEVRLGGIYALERLAIDSPRDHWTIMEVLCTYVRRNAPWVEPEAPAEEQADEDHGKAKPKPTPRTDIQAILTVLGRRRRDERREQNRALELSDSDLRGAKLVSAHLENVILNRAHLEHSFLDFAHLEHSFLDFAHLEHSSLYEAHLESARLYGAHLEDANLSDAHLEGTTGLRVKQVKAAEFWEYAYYDPEFRARLGLPPEGSDAPAPPPSDEPSQAGSASAGGE